MKSRTAIRNSFYKKVCVSNHIWYVYYMILNILFLDTQLAIVCLSLISLLFHLIGTALLIIGFVSSLSSRTLYFYHSAGECLITSCRLNWIDLILPTYTWLCTICIEALVLMIDLSAFALVVQFQTAEHYHSFRFGFCFYINTLLAILILSSAIILHLDDLVNEWMIWKVKAEYASSTAAMLSRQSSASPKPADIFLSSIWHIKKRKECCFSRIYISLLLLSTSIIHHYDNKTLII